MQKRAAKRGRKLAEMGGNRLHKETCETRRGHDTERRLGVARRPPRSAHPEVTSEIRGLNFPILGSRKFLGKSKRKYSLSSRNEFSNLFHYRFSGPVRIRQHYGRESCVNEHV